ncbi:MAG: hypothetical protein AAF965_00270 [Pseudomonadota bacterium]
MSKKIVVTTLLVLGLLILALLVVFDRILDPLNPPGSDEVPVGQDFVPTIADQLRQAAEAGNVFESFYPEDFRREIAEYQFWGKTTTGSEGTCLVSYRDFHLSAYSRIKEPSSLPYPSDAILMSCEDFFLVEPPTPPHSMTVLGRLTTALSPACFPVISEGSRRGMNGWERPKEYVSIATVLRGYTAQSLLDRAHSELAGGEIIQVGGDNADPVRLSRANLLARTNITPVNTLSCDGFDVLHYRIEPQIWPLDIGQSVKQ